MCQLSIVDVPLGSVSEIRQLLDDAMIRPAVSTDLDLVCLAFDLSSKRAELLTDKLENERYDIAVKLGLTM